VISEAVLADLAAAQRRREAARGPAGTAILADLAAAQRRRATS
jgi:hypothetical protein